jgi:hypothetical protein
MRFLRSGRNTSDGPHRFRYSRHRLRVPQPLTRTGLSVAIAKRNSLISRGH